MNPWAGPLFAALTVLSSNAPAQKSVGTQKPKTKKAAPKPASPAYGMSGATFWRTRFGDQPNWFVVAGDADGDGHGDLLAVSRRNAILQMAPTSPLGKPLPEITARPPVGADTVAAASGPFVRAKGADVLTVSPDGAMRLTSGWDAAKNAYARTEPAGTIPKEAIPQEPTRTVTGDFDGDGRLDALILDKTDTLLLLRNEGTGGFKPVPIRTKLPGAKQFTAGTLNGVESARVVWLDEAGNVDAAPLANGALGTPKIVGRGLPDDHLAVGRFRGAKVADVLLGQRLFPGGDLKSPQILKDLPPLDVAKEDVEWEVADLDGNGKDDLIRHPARRGGWGATDVVVHFSYDAGEPYKGYHSTANDGLPDAWKLGKIKPGALDLAALGCKVGRRDVIVEIETFDNFNPQELRTNMDRAVKYFASIPLVNPDGTTGIALHVIYKEPWPIKDHDKVMGRADATFPPRERRGVVHTMFAEAGGPLVSAINGDFGHFNGHWQEFCHEFGHQLDLVHDGFMGSDTRWYSDTGSAIYPSMMSYTYSYGYDNQGDWVRYSDGKRASFPMNPRHLSEKLPFAFDDVRFLGAEPYHFRVTPAPDGKSTLIDWNWNGVLGEDDVVANVKYTHGTDFGRPYTLGKTTTAPIVVDHGGRPLVVYGNGATLAVRAWLGRNRDTEGGNWSEEGADYAAAPTGDPTAAYLGGATWIAYPTAKGVMLRKAVLDGAGKPVLGPPDLLGGTAGALPTVAALDGKLVLLLWRNKTFPVGMGVLRPEGAGLKMSAPRPLDFVSDVPVGAVAGRPGTDFSALWVGRIAPDGTDHGGASEVLRLDVGPSGGGRVVSRYWVAGVYARHRMTLLWEEGGPKLPEGRIYLVAGGIQPGGTAGHEQYITMNIPYADYGGGWMIHRYRNPDFRGLSAPGACLFQKDVLVAFYQTDGNLNVGFYGTGATPRNMGDFDDIGHVRDYGLSRSIRNFQRP